MYRSVGWTILFCVEIFVGLCDAIASNEAIFRDLSVDERRSFFGTEDGSVPEFELVELTQSPRSKRASNVLTIPFKYHGTETTATLYFVQDLDLISTTTTAVWFAESDRLAHHDVVYTPKPDILDDIGQFYYFHNEDECSAITKFWKSSREVAMIGVLKQDYTVRSLPRGFENGFTYINSSHSIVSRSADSRSDHDENSPLYLVIFEHQKPAQEYFRRYSRSPSLPDLELHRIRRQIGRQPSPFRPPNVVYPKLLIAPDYNVVTAEKTVEDFLRLLIAHLNAIDMMYRQLGSPDVRLQIGGIIIPRDSSATPYMAPNTDQATSFFTEGVLETMKNYFKEESNRLQADTYSTFIALTNKDLHNYNAKGERKNVAGTAMVGTACDWGRAILKYRQGFSGVMTMAHELGHVFDAAHDGPDCPAGDGYAMVPDVNMGRTLKWSTCTRQTFSNFFRSRLAICTHLRSYGVPNSVRQMPGSWISLRGQCENHMKNATGFCFNSFVTCSVYGCSKSACYWMPDPPMEGTLSGDGKRCVNQKWVNE